MKYVVTLLCVLVVSAPRHSPEPTITAARASQDTSLIRALLDAEDARADTPDAMAPLMRGLASSDSSIQLIAVRALGRFERPSLIPLIVPLLSAGTPSVRAEAANALGQAVMNDDAETVHPLLVARLAEEDDPIARGSILQTLGRLPYRSPERVGTIAELLLDALDEADAELGGGRVTQHGAARGLESLLRLQASRYTPPPQVTAGLQHVALAGPPGGNPSAERGDVVRIRRLATAAAVASGVAESDFLMQAVLDPDAAIRRFAVLAAGVAEELRNRSRIVAAALRDDSPTVRFEALRAYARRLQPDFGCEPVRTSLLDPNVHVALLAIDLLGAGCATGEAPERILLGLAAQLPSSTNQPSPAWHKPAHALVALAQLDPRLADPLLPRFVDHPRWQVRMYAARAAAYLGTTTHLERLAFDPHHNVREAAIVGLRSQGAQADSVYIAALDNSDYQLIRTAARALRETTTPAPVMPGLLRTLRRVTDERRETSRNPRLALLETLIAYDDPSLADSLAPWLRDFDTAVADRVSGALTRWTGQDHVASPTPLPRLSAPTPVELTALEQTRVVLHMANGGAVELRLLPWEAPTNAARFVRLARTGYFDGLTFHRVVPNFVIQGGSPGANEYAGDGPYTRDEVTRRAHRRGTVGLSTRGRDTGDGQIFINVVDNHRLDHNYTIFAEVVAGMDVVDGILEGAVINRVIVEPR